MNEIQKPRNIVMWLKTVEDQEHANFNNKKAVAYHKFFKTISERDNFRFAYDLESYKGNGVFDNVAVYKDGQIEKSQESFVAEAIYQFNNIHSPADLDYKPAVITNTPEFRIFCGRKINQYQLLEKFFPLTMLAKSKDEIRRLLKDIKTKKVVLKPNGGQNGDDVFIFDTDKVDLSVIPEDKLIGRGFLVQEFIDTSAGIPNIAPSYHDLRIVTHGDRISLCHVRQPAEGSFVSNSHKGASITEIDIDAIPPFIMDFYTAVHGEIIKKYPKPLYSMDIGIGEDGPKLIELNSHTAFPGEGFRCMDRFIKNLVYHLETIS